MPRFDLSYETRDGRCAWCWTALGDTASHSVVRSMAAPVLELRFHHECWPAYKSLSGIENGNVGIGGDWPPRRIEELRLHAGLPLVDFARRLGVTPDTYQSIMGDDAGALGPGVLQRVKALATETRFGLARGGIDWTRSEAVFCFRMHLSYSLGQMAGLIGCRAAMVQTWQWQGVPARSIRTHGRLTELARKHNFDAGMIVDHRLWTLEFLQQSFEAHQHKYVASLWALRGGTNSQTFRQWLRGARKITPEAAWHLTRAAQQLGLPLPPVGLVPLRKGAWSVERQPLNGADEAKRLEALRTSKWDLDSIRLLGTLPDRVLAKQLGHTRNSVAIMRRAMGIACVDVRGWDGQARPMQLSDAELQERWDKAREQLRLSKYHYRDGVKSS